MIICIWGGGRLGSKVCRLGVVICRLLGEVLRRRFGVIWLKSWDIVIWSLVVVLGVICRLSAGILSVVIFGKISALGIIL